MSTLTNQSSLVNDQRVAHAVYGEGEPVVLIHGTPSSSYIWRNVMPLLVEAGFQVHLFDLLGFGASERPCDPNIDTSVSAQTPLLAKLFDIWALEKAHIIAHDIGGAVALQFALDHRPKVHSLSLMDSVSYDSWPSPRTRQLLEQGIDVLVKKSDADHYAHFKEWLESAVYHQDRFAEDGKDAFLSLITGPVGQASLFQHQIKHYDPVHTLKIMDRMEELDHLNVNILWGENDTWQVTDWAHRLHGDIPGSTLHIMPECGHFSPEDQPEEIARRCIAYMRTRMIA